MNIDQFDKAVADIEKDLEGGGYTIDIHMVSGQVWRRATWRYATEGERSLLALDIGDSPLIYVPVEAIEAVHLCN